MVKSSIEQPVSSSKSQFIPNLLHLHPAINQLNAADLTFKIVIVLMDPNLPLHQ